MSIDEALVWATLQLIYSKTPILDAEVLLCHLLKKDKAWLYTHQFVILTRDRARKYQSLIFRRKKGEPVAYLTRQQEFYGLNFYVNKNVLIPRTETELLVEEVLKFLESGIMNQELGKKTLSILDVGTGSGNIIISLIVNSKQLTVNSKYYASDVSNQTLKVARKNAQKHKVQINFIKSDLFQNIAKNLKFDLIVANLPYLDPKWINSNLKYEPKKALDGGKNGLKIIKQFLIQAKNYLAKNGAILFEIDPRQAKLTKKLVKNIFPKKKIKIDKDLTGLNRIVIVR